MDGRFATTLVPMEGSHGAQAPCFVADRFLLEGEGGFMS